MKTSSRLKENPELKFCHRIFYLINPLLEERDTYYQRVEKRYAIYRFIYILILFFGIIRISYILKENPVIGIIECAFYVSIVVHGICLWMNNELFTYKYEYNQVLQWRYVKRQLVITDEFELCNNILSSIDPDSEEEESFTQYPIFCTLFEMAFKLNPRL